MSKTVMVIKLPPTKLRKIFGKPVVAHEDKSKYQRRKKHLNEFEYGQPGEGEV